VSLILFALQRDWTLAAAEQAGAELTRTHPADIWFAL
jgi:hypothetical protein